MYFYFHFNFCWMTSNWFFFLLFLGTLEKKPKNSKTLMISKSSLSSEESSSPLTGNLSRNSPIAISKHSLSSVFSQGPLLQKFLKALLLVTISLSQLLKRSLENLNLKRPWFGKKFCFKVFCGSILIKDSKRFLKFPFSDFSSSFYWTSEFNFTIFVLFRLSLQWFCFSLIFFLAKHLLVQFFFCKPS